MGARRWFGGWARVWEGKIGSKGEKANMLCQFQAHSNIIQLYFSDYFPHSLLHNVDYSSLDHTVNLRFFFMNSSNSLYLLTPYFWFTPSPLPLWFVFYVCEFVSVWVQIHLQHFFFRFHISVQFSSVAQSCPILCDPMNRSAPGLPVHHQLPEFTQTHVHRVSDAIQPSHPLSSPSPSAPNPSQHQSLFK